MGTIATLALVVFSWSADWERQGSILTLCARTDHRENDNRLLKRGRIADMIRKNRLSIHLLVGDLDVMVEQARNHSSQRCY